MASYERRLTLILVGVLALVAIVMLSGKASEELAPEPRAAHVAIRADGDEVARVGRVELEAGTAFDLFAVLEAETWRGDTVYYTEAPRLEIRGSEVSADALRIWRRPLEARVLWFAVQGSPPYLEIGSEEALAGFELREAFYADWPRTWKVPGSVLAASTVVEQTPRGRFAEFGTQRYHARIELYGNDSRVVPEMRFRSPGAEELLRDPAGFPTVVAKLPGLLARPSSVFGLSQLELPAAAPRSLRSRLAAWEDARLMFSRLALIGRVLADAGVAWEGLAWEGVELDGTAAWGAGGDLIRAGGRVVIALADRGRDERLDYDDLVFDYERGAAVRSLREVFSGEGLVERARLADASGGG